MSVRLGFVVVEGPHDRAFVGRILKGLGFTAFKGAPGKLNPDWAAWKPDYPKDDNLYVPLDMPSIWESADWSVAVYVAGGGQLKSESRGFYLRLKNRQAFLERLCERGAFGLIVDSDEEAPEVVRTLYQRIYGRLFPGFAVKVGEVVGMPQQPRHGLFVLPDGVHAGTVESVILPLGQTHYGEILDDARAFVSRWQPHFADRWAPFDCLKATVATTASLLQPGSTNTVTIEKDEWITADDLTHPEIAPVVAFIKSLLELP